MTFQDGNAEITLRGVQSVPQQVQELPAEQVVKWYKGNEIWSMVFLHEVQNPIAAVTESTEVQSLLTEFSDVFQKPTQLPPPRQYDHTIPLLPGATPVNSRPYCYSPLHKDEIERQVQELLSTGLIVPSSSPFASPVRLVQQKDGSWRFCVDFRKLNDITVKNRFPLPLIEEVLEELAGTKYFTKLDLCAGFHQIHMNPADEAKTAFKTHHGHYQFRVMPFSLTSAPATFQYTMNTILGPYLRKFVMVFLDDILIYSPNLEYHLIHLGTVLTKLREHKFFVKLSKCTFAQHSLEYLGHIISDQGVATDPSKTEAMLHWPRPTNVTELRGFLGLTGYYRRFIRHYGIIAKPLTSLLKKHSFQWTEQSDDAFSKLKTAMAQAPVLALPDFSDTLTVETDA